MLNCLNRRRHAHLIAICVGANLLHVAASSPILAEESETMVGTSTLAGWVYIDRNNDGILNFYNDPDPEFVISGVEIRLYEKTASGYELFDTTLTSDGGRYIFNGLPAGEYAIKQVQPIEFVDGKDTIGMLINKSGQPLPANASPGTPIDNGFEDIVLPENTRGDFYNFGELGLAPGYVSKRYLLGSAPVWPHAVPEPSSFLLLLTAGLVNGRWLRMRRHD